MKNDIDFDELDKAVSSLMGGAKPAQPDGKPAAQESEPAAIAPQPAERPAAPAVGSLPRPAAPRPTNGRFMDVVRPSAASQPVVQPAAVPPAAQPSADQSAPLTPFLPDAKVEKRPLGAVPSPFGDADDSVAPETVPINSELPDAPKNDSQTELDATAIPGEHTPESPELQAIESVEVAEVPDHMHEAVRSVESVDTENLAVPTAPAANVGNDRAAPAQDGTIYDTDQYHQPLGHPKKQRSGWGVVLIIIVIVALAAALGAAAYFILGIGI